MADEKITEDLLIKTTTEKTARSTGDKFAVVDTNKGEYTCWDTAVVTELEKNFQKVCSVVTEKSGKYNNIREFLGLSETQDVPVERIKESAEPERIPESVRSQLTSYAKDIVLACREDWDSIEKGMVAASKAIVKGYQEISKKL